MAYSLNRPFRWQTAGSPACTCQVPSESEEFVEVSRYFYDSVCMPREFVNLVRVDRIENEALFRPYAVYSELIRSELEDVSPSAARDTQLWLWHMCDDWVENVLQNGFAQNRAELVGNFYGRGIYFARDPRLAHRSIVARTSTGKHLKPGEDFQILLAQVAVGACKEVPKFMKLLHHRKAEPDAPPRGYHSITGEDCPGREIVVFPGPLGSTPAYAAYVVSYRLTAKSEAWDVSMVSPVCADLKERWQSQLFSQYKGSDIWRREVDSETSQPRICCAHCNSTELLRRHPQNLGEIICARCFARRPKPGNAVFEDFSTSLDGKLQDLKSSRDRAGAPSTKNMIMLGGVDDTGGEFYCAECGTVNGLEEDGNEPDMFYCNRCWVLFEEAITDYGEDATKQCIDNIQEFKDSATPPSSENADEQHYQAQLLHPRVPAPDPLEPEVLPPEPEIPEDVRDGLSDIDDRDDLFDSDGLDGPDDLGLDRAPFGDWSPLQSLPVPRSHLAAATLNDVVYAIGGRNGCGTSLAQVECFDRWTHRWESVAPMSIDRHGLAAASTGDAIYAVGGRTSSGSILPNTERLDPRMRNWAILAPLPMPRESLGIAVCGNDIFAFGGRNGRGDAVRNAERYDIRKGKWADIAPLTLARDGLGAGFLNGKVYALGGRGKDNTCTDVVERYDPRERNWSLMAPMTTARDGFAVATLHGRLYAIGGRDHGASSLAIVERFKPWTNTWAFARSLPVPCDGLAASRFCGAVVALGGRTSQGIRSGLAAAAMDGALFECSGIGTRLKHGTPAASTVVRLKLRRGLMDLEVWRNLCLRRDEAARQKRQWVEDVQLRELQLLAGHVSEQRAKLATFERRLQRADLLAKAHFDYRNGF